MKKYIYTLLIAIGFIGFLASCSSDNDDPVLPPDTEDPDKPGKPDEPEKPDEPDEKDPSINYEFLGTWINPPRTPENPTDYTRIMTWAPEDIKLWEYDLLADVFEFSGVDMNFPESGFAQNLKVDLAEHLATSGGFVYQIFKKLVEFYTPYLVKSITFEQDKKHSITFNYTTSDADLGLSGPDVKYINLSKGLITYSNVTDNSFDVAVDKKGLAEEYKKNMTTAAKNDNRAFLLSTLPPKFKVNYVFVENGTLVLYLKEDFLKALADHITAEKETIKSSLTYGIVLPYGTDLIPMSKKWVSTMIDKIVPEFPRIIKETTEYTVEFGVRKE